MVDCQTQSEGRTKTDRKTDEDRLYNVLPPISSLFSVISAESVPSQLMDGMLEWRVDCTAVILPSSSAAVLYIHGGATVCY